MSPRPIGVSCEICTLSPTSRSVFGTCSDDVEAEPLPRVQRRDRVHLRERGLLGRVGLEQRPRQDLVDAQRAAAMVMSPAIRGDS